MELGSKLRNCAWTDFTLQTEKVKTVDLSMRTRRKMLLDNFFSKIIPSFISYNRILRSEQNERELN